MIETDTYDIAGNQLTARDASGVTTNNTYDCLGNKTASWQSVSGTAQKDHWQSFTYDPLGRLLTQTTKLSDSAATHHAKCRDQHLRWLRRQTHLRFDGGRLSPRSGSTTRW